MPEIHYARGQDGVHIAYMSEGEGQDVIFLPPLGFALEDLWEDAPTARFLRRLTSLGRLTVFDRRGTGASDPAVGGRPPTPDDWVDDSVLVMDALKIETAIVIGLGAGATVALIVAALHPARVSGLVLMDAFARVLADEDYPFGATRQEMEHWLDTQPAHWGQTGIRAQALAPSRAHDPTFVEWLVRTERRSIRKTDVRAHLKTFWDTDVRALLPLISASTLLISHPGMTSLGRAEHAEYIAARLENVRHLKLSGSDYPIWGETADDTVAAITSFAAGDRVIPDPDRVAAAVLFTDIVESTTRAIDIGDARWRRLLDKHDMAVNSVLVRHRGRLVKLTGDGILATFDGPARAVMCARELVVALDEIGLPIRAGVHVGEVDLRGNDVSGVAVHFGQRVCMEAHAGEVLVSGAVIALAPGADLEFEDRGEHELKGIPGNWRLFALAG